jgi:hypothetical protein
VSEQPKDHEGRTETDKRPDHFKEEYDLSRHFPLREITEGVLERVLCSLEPGPLQTL